jgi:hypothetical protein
MSIFGNIMSAIFGKSAEAKAAEPSAAPGAAPAQPTTTSAPASTGSAPTAAASAPTGASAAAPSPVDVAAVLSGLACAEQAETQLADVDRRSDEASRPRQQPCGPQTARPGTALQRRYGRLRIDEHLVAQASHDQARREWWQGSRRTAGMTGCISNQTAAQALR